MPRIDIVAHASSSYVPRTRENADTGDLTIAVAADYSSAGERLTKRSAGSRYLALPISDAPLASARTLFRTLRDRGFLDGARRPVLNVAGNGVYTLLEHGIDQARANAHLFEMFRHLQPHLPLGRIISGGQTGIDFAGAVAGHALGLDVRMLLPAGFLQRGADGVDRAHTADELRAQLIEQAAALEAVSSPSGV